MKKTWMKNILVLAIVSLFLVMLIGIFSVNIWPGAAFYEWYKVTKPTFSLDEKNILFSKNGSVFCRDGHDGKITCLTPRGAGREEKQAYDALPSYSHDGRLIVFSRGTNQGGVLWEMNADGTGRKQMTFQAGVLDKNAKYSPSGRFIAFFRQYPGLPGAEHHLCAFDRDTNSLKTIKHDLEPFPQDIFWKDDETLYYISGTKCDVVYEVNGTSGVSKKHDRHPRLSTLSFDCDKEIGLLTPTRKYLYQACARKSFSSDQWEVLTDKTYNVSHAAMSKSGRFLVFVHNEYSNGRPSKKVIYISDLDASSTKEAMILHP